MNNVRLVWYLSFFLSFLIFAGCGKGKTAENTVARPVKTVEVKKETHPEQLEYIGTVGSKDIKKYAFKIPGKIKDIYVEKGQRVSKGTLLAELDGTDISFAVSDAEHTQQKAKDAFDEAETFYQHIKALNEKGSVTNDDLAKAKLNRNVREADFKRSQVDVDYKKNIMTDAKLLSEIEGFVIEIVFKKGEITGAGYPVVVVRNERQIVNVGVSQKDIMRLSHGTPAFIEIDGVKGRGRIINIGQIPDLQSRTYTVEVDFTDKVRSNSFYLGSIAKVIFDIGTKEAIWIPIRAIQTDGQDFVLTVKNGFAERRAVRLGSVHGSEVEVEGVNSGESLIIEGMKDLRHGSKVVVK